MKLVKDPESGVYAVIFKGGDGKTHQRTTRATNEADAKAIVEASGIKRIELAAKAGALTSEALTAVVAGRKVTVADAILQWMEWMEINREPSTAKNQSTFLNAWVERIDAKRWPISRITEQHIDGYVNDESDATAATRGSRLAAIRSFFLFASARGYLVGNPAALIEVRLRNLSHEQKEPKKRVPITADEYRRIMAWPVEELALGQFMRSATAIAYWCGLRLGDIASLEWASFTGSELVVWTGKRDARVALPLSDPLIGSGELSLVFIGLMEDRRPDARYVFPAERKIAMDMDERAKLSVYYGRFLEKVGIEGKSFHCLRHSFATRLKRAGKTLEEIGRVIGHSNTKTTEGYTHT